jgi:hypothetical protein
MKYLKINTKLRDNLYTYKCSLKFSIWLSELHNRISLVKLKMRIKLKIDAEQTGKYVTFIKSVHRNLRKQIPSVGIKPVLYRLE